MADRDALAEFQSSMEAVIGRATDERVRIILQIVTASLDADRLAQLQADLDKLPDNSPRRDVLNFPRVAEQIAAVAPQIIALELDRTTPLQILGLGRIAGPVLFSVKCFGHAVTAVARLNFVSDLMFKFYGVPCFHPKAPGELPEGPFDFIITYGGANLSTKRDWAGFLLPLVGRLSETGRIFVALTAEPNPRRQYYPDVVLSKLARMGARVSSRHGYVLLDRAALQKFDPAAKPEPAEDAGLDPDPTAGDSVVPAPEALPNAQPTSDRGVQSNWKIGAALVACFTILLGLWSRFGRPLS